MSTCLRLLLCASALIGFAPARAAAAEAATPNAEHARAGDRCEEAVAETIRRMRGHQARDIEFVGAKRAIAPTPDELLGVKGEGRYRGATGGETLFTYSCAFNAHTGATSGVVFRDAPTHSAQVETPALQPDLTTFSPEPCESATASALKNKYPRVENIAFDAGTRQLRAATHELSRLEGGGALVRSPGMPSSPFHFRCEFETAGGKVVNVQTRE